MSDVYRDKNNYKNNSLIHYNHSKLGECVVPGKSIKFSTKNEILISEAPEIGKDNDKYGL